MDILSNSYLEMKVLIFFIILVKYSMCSYVSVNYIACVIFYSSHYFYQCVHPSLFLLSSLTSLEYKCVFHSKKNRTKVWSSEVNISYISRIAVTALLQFLIVITIISLVRKFLRFFGNGHKIFQKVLEALIPRIYIGRVNVVRTKTFRLI